MSFVFWKGGIVSSLACVFLICAAAQDCPAQASPVARARETRQAHPVLADDKRTAVLEGQKHLPLPKPGAAAQPAKVSLKDGILTIAASNSDLAQILKDLSDKSGMKVQGLSKSPRIFGVYGPGDSREVLRSLLAGLGYNFIIVGGDHDSVPRELMLAPITATSSNEPRYASEVDDDAGPPEQQQTDLEERGPGAVYPVPPPATEDDGTRIEQNMQRLQHLEERRNDPQ